MTPSRSSIDLDVIANFKAAVGAADFDRLAKSCVAVGMATLDELTAAVERSDMAAVQFCAHKLAGLFSQFGLLSLDTAARNIESMEIAGLFAAAAQLVADGRRGMEELKAVAAATLPGQ
jgi:Hpt domain